MEVIISLLIFGTLTFGTIASSDQSTNEPFQEEHPAQINEYAFISMERTPCLGKCPSYKIIIYNSGRVSYEGFSFVEYEGSYETILSKAELKRLSDKMASIDIYKLEDKYDTYKTDIPSCILHLNDGEQSKKIYDRDGAPEALKEFERLVDRIVLKKELKKLKKTE